MAEEVGVEGPFHRHRTAVLVAAALVWLPIAAANAGPPFNTDFAQPIEPGHTEIDLYSDVAHAQFFTSATLPGIQADHGLAPDVQVRAVVPFVRDSGTPDQYGLGDVQFGVKYRFLDDNAGQHWWPQLAVFPVVLAPTGDRQRGLGQGGPALSLPLWAQKNIGPWKIYGGGGYTLDYGVGTRNSGFLGLAVLRQFGSGLSLGGEIFEKQANRRGASDSTTVHIGGSYDITERYHLYFSVGRSLQNPAMTDRIAAYIALGTTF
jgi:hypothetical protein